jgi:hypothetical protein
MSEVKTGLVMMHVVLRFGDESSRKKLNAMEQPIAA